MNKKKWILGTAITGTVVCVALALNSFIFPGALDREPENTAETAAVQTIEPASAEIEPAEIGEPVGDVPSADAISQEEARANAIASLEPVGNALALDFSTLPYTVQYIADESHTGCPLWVVTFSDLPDAVRKTELFYFIVEINALTGEHVAHTIVSTAPGDDPELYIMDFLLRQAPPSSQPLQTPLPAPQQTP